MQIKYSFLHNSMCNGDDFRVRKGMHSNGQLTDIHMKEVYALWKDVFENYQVAFNHSK